MQIKVVVDNSLRISRDLPVAIADELKALFSHSNPVFYRKSRFVRNTRQLATTDPPVIDTWAWGSNGGLVLPRGGTQRLREVFDRHHIQPIWEDRRTQGSELLRGRIPPHEVDLWHHQHDIVEVARRRENVLIQSPVGSGKTTATIAFASLVQLPTVVIVRTAALLEQWVKRVQKELPGFDVGIVRQRVFDLQPITIAMQQTIHRLKPAQQDIFNRSFGVLVYDEVHQSAAKSVASTVGSSAARYRVGLSDDPCVARGTMILMADGVEIPIEDVAEGDFVVTPLGSRRVTAKIFTGILETILVRIGERVLRCTPNTRFGTPVGWRYSETPCHPFVYETLRDLPITNAASLPDCVSYCVQADRSRREWQVSSLRNRSGVGTSGEWSHDGTSQFCPMGQGQDEGERSEVGKNFRCDEDAPGADPDRDSSGARYGSSDTTRQSEISGDCHRVVSERASQGLVGQLRQRCRCSEDRDGGVGIADESRVCPSACCTNGDTGRSTISLHDRFCASIVKDCDRDRWTASSSIRGADRGYAEGCSSEQVRSDDRSISDGFGRTIAAARQRFGVDRSEPFDERLFVPTFDLEVDEAECFFANGILTHNTRKDRLDFIIVDHFGPIALQVSEAEVQRSGHVVPVSLRMLGTEFDADWYVEQLDRQEDNPDYNRLIAELTDDDRRSSIAVEAALDYARQGHQVLLMSQRVEHCRALARWLRGDGHDVGLMIGGPENAPEMRRSIERLRSGEMRIAVGTVQAIGTGIDVPTITRGVLTTPLYTNRQLLRQVRGRFCRAAPGKFGAEIAYLYDFAVFGARPYRNMKRLFDNVLLDETVEQQLADVRDA